MSRLEAIEQAWLAGSDEEDVYFAAFEQPAKLRRSRQIKGALSSLKFGQYQDMNNDWIDDRNAVWLSMLVSEEQGAGKALIDALTMPLARAGLALIGTPNAMPLRNWDASRPAFKNEDLIAWYLKRGFKVVQSETETRVVYARYPVSLQTNFSLINKRTPPAEPDESRTS